MVENRQNTEVFGHYLMASGLLGGLFAPIILFNLELESDSALSAIVGYIPSSTQILGSITIVFASVALCKNRNSWICTTRTTVESKVKVIAIWVLGIMLCILQQTNDYEYHSTRIFSKIAKNSTLVFVLLLTLFITWCSRFVFYETRKIKYVMSFLAVVSIINWLDATVLSSIFLNECNSTDLGKGTDVSKSIPPEHQILYLFSFIMEFSIQVTTFVITIPMTKSREDNGVDPTWEYHQEDLEGTCRHVSLCRKQKFLVVLTSSVLNTPFVIFIAFTPTSLNELVNKYYVWLYCIVGAKIVVFIFITIAYHNLYKNVTIRTERVTLNFNDIALILGTSAVAASGLVNFLYKIDSNKFIISFHTLFNIVYSIYQTIFVLFLKFIVIRDKTSPLLIRVRMIVIILVSYNILYWVKDSLFFLPLIKSDIHGKLYKTLFFLLYPLVSFYRFQSAMGMIPFLF